jgi:hypothetical protein
MEIKAQKKCAYQAFGLVFESDIPLLELTPINLLVRDVDINITNGDLSHLLSELANHQGKFMVKEKLVAFHIPDTATFCIKDGAEIIISALKGSEVDKIRLYILGTCIAILLMQRKVLTFHGSAVEIEGRAYGIIGDSGAGKSTLASAFINKGYKLLSDDLIPVTISQKGIPFVIPSYPQQKLWKESLQAFGEETTQYRPLFERETKYAVPIHSSFKKEAIQLSGLFELIKTEKETIEYISIEGLQRFRTLFNQTFRNTLIPRMNLIEWHFTESAKILKMINLYQLQRPENGFTAPELVNKILNIIEMEESICLKQQVSP